MTSLDISQITDYLYVGAQPGAEHAGELRARDVRLIISMIGTARPAAVFAKPPFRLLWLRTYDSFLTPIPVSKLMEGVRAALPVIRSGGRVLAYCAQGRHRSAAMAAAILIAMDYSAEEAMRLLQARRRSARPQTWYVKRQIKRFEKHWRQAHPWADASG
jgi:protein-tyrosine phosphatase